jgi:hypothetical protein
VPAIRGAGGRFVKVRDTDKGAKSLLARMRAAASKPHALTLGVHDEEGAATEKDSPLTVAEVAEINEFGLGVPRRSFITDWADEYQATHESNLRKMGTALVKGRIASVEQGLAQLAVLYVGLIQTRISAGIGEPNAESTVKRKGSSRQLVRYGQLRSAIRGKVNGIDSGAGV